MHHGNAARTRQNALEATLYSKDIPM